MRSSSGRSATCRALRICSCVHLLRVGIVLLSPVGLHEDAVDLFEADFAFAVADGFQKRTDAEVAYAAQNAFGGAYDERERVVGKDGVRQSAGIELVEDERLDVVGCEGF